MKNDFTLLTQKAGLFFRITTLTHFYVDETTFERFVRVKEQNVFVNCDIFQEDERRADAISMLEQSSQAGCLQSSYLLWEHNRKAAVSVNLAFSVLMLWAGGILMYQQFHHGQKDTLPEHESNFFL